MNYKPYHYINKKYLISAGGTSLISNIRQKEITMNSELQSIPVKSINIQDLSQLKSIDIPYSDFTQIISKHFQNK